jgi:seryl-tRNA synthetase
MLHINKIRENKDSYIALLKLKNVDVTDLFHSVIARDDERKATQQQSDELLAKGNQFAKQIGEMYKTGKVAEANLLKEESSLIKKESKSLQIKQIELEQSLLYQIDVIYLNL